MMRLRNAAIWLLVAAAAVSAPRSLAAQEQVRASQPLVKWGKWVLVAGSIGMNLMAADAHQNAESVFDDIEARCAQNETLCFAGEDGSYLDPGTEALYQETLRHDRRARGWLIGGQGALVGAAALFIWEFTRPKLLPDNIPFEPEVEVGAETTRIGVNLRF